MFARLTIFAYSLICYAVGFVALLYAIGFIGGHVVPKTIDSGPTLLPTGAAIVVDLLLLGLFALQHSGMARRGFKRVWTRIVPAAGERATYVLFTAAVLAVLFWLWQPLPGEAWHVANREGAAVLTVAYFAGWGIVLLSTFLINHFELFGLQQAFAALRGRAFDPPRFRTPLLYRLVRHPLYMGLLLAFWATPVMSGGHLLFALGTTAYILLGIALEERDLVHAFGEAYRAYRRAVPMIIPLPRPGKPHPQHEAEARSE